MNNNQGTTIVYKAMDWRAGTSTTSREFVVSPVLVERWCKEIASQLMLDGIRPITMSMTVILDCGVEVPAKKPKPKD
jgi:hypothetical protein